MCPEIGLLSMKILLELLRDARTFVRHGDFFRIHPHLAFGFLRSHTSRTSIQLHDCCYSFTALSSCSSPLSRLLAFVLSLSTIFLFVLAHRLVPKRMYSRFFFSLSLVFSSPSLLALSLLLLQPRCCYRHFFAISIWFMGFRYFVCVFVYSFNSFHFSSSSIFFKLNNMFACHFATSEMKALQCKWRTSEVKDAKNR